MVDASPNTHMAERIAELRSERDEAAANAALYKALAVKLLDIIESGGSMTATEIGKTRTQLK